MVIGAGVLGVFGGAAISRSQPEPDFSKMSADDLMKMMETMSAPVEEHKVLDAFVGSFDLKGNFTMIPGRPMPWESTSAGKKILGGRFVETNTISKPGQKYTIESKAVFGFDSRPGRGVYTLWGVDTMGTYSVSAEGSYDAATKVLTVTGVEKHGDQEMKYRQTFNISDQDKHIVKVDFEEKPGEWRTVVDMVATRKK